MPDPWENPDGQNETALQAMITRLEERGNHPEFQRMIREYASAIAADKPLKVLDLGCGTGVVACHLEGCLDPRSELHGADVSEKILEAARTIHGSSRVNWVHVTGDILPYPDSSFDVIVMHTLLSHVPQVSVILREAARILKSDGRIIIFDADHAGTTYGYPDFEKMREINHKLITSIATQPDICRQLPRYLKAAGFSLDSHRSYIISECGRGDFWLSSVRSFARLIPALNILPEKEGAEWIEHMLRSHEDGTFFAFGTYFTFFARKCPTSA